MKVLLVYGGDSAEHMISVKSKDAVYKALIKNGFDVMACEPDKDFIKNLLEYSPDVVYNVIHGAYGEDGRVQSILDFYNIPYTGSGMESSCMTFNKAISKDIMKANGILTMDYDTLRKTDNISDYVPRYDKVVVKASRQGSSLGVYLSDRNRVHKDIQKAFKFDDVVIVEELIEGEEFTITVNEGKAYKPILLKTDSEFYDFDAKYTYSKGETSYLFEYDIDSDIIREMKDSAEHIYNVFDCKGVARVDLILRDNNSYFLEINTIPGMTETSLVPKSAAYEGISFEDLVKESVYNALKRED